MASILFAFEPIILVVHFLAAFFLISVILLQAGKGTDIGSMFGAGSSQSLFGARGAATLLSKLTTITAVLFLFTSLGLATISNYAARGGETESVITDGEDVMPTTEETGEVDLDGNVDATPAPQNEQAPAVENPALPEDKPE